MINLCLVVIATQFSETKKREMERMRLERARFQSSSTLASSTNNSEPNSCYAEIVKYIAHLWRRGKRRILKKIRLYRVRRDQRREKKMISGETIRLNYAKRHHPNCPKLKQPTQTISTSSMCLNENRTDEMELSAISKRPSVLKVPSASNQEISSNNNDVSLKFCGGMTLETIFQSPTNLLSPSCIPEHRRRSSVMFSDVIVLHGENESSSPGSSSNIDKKNVCSSEKTTQAGELGN